MDAAYIRIAAVLHRGLPDLGSWLLFHCDGLQPSFEWLPAGYQRMGAMPGR